MKKHLLLFTIAICLAGNAQSQVNELERSRLNQAAYYNYTESGDVTIKVHVWGAVRFAGLYEIPRGTTLSGLVSLAGGPQFSERNRRATRFVDLKLHRNQEARKTAVFQIQMENRLMVMDEDPVLLDEDVLTFESTISQ
ncbi:MAG: SLBB domain-containing protein, partial [Proteobacteria bacterium]|nr:SLBB domain-containing protein [Pseudomonadota bacterium]